MICEGTPVDPGRSAGNVKLRNLYRLLGYLIPYWKWVALTVVVMFASALAGQAGPYLTKLAIDDYVIPGNPNGVERIVLIYLLLLLAQFGLGYAQSWVTAMVGQWTMRDVRLQIFDHLQRLPVRFFDGTPIGALMARNTADVEALNGLYTDSLATIAGELATIVTILGFIWYLDPTIGVMALAVVPIFAGIVFWIQHYNYAAIRRSRKHFSAFTATLQETLTGMETVQLFNWETQRAERFDGDNDQYMNARLQNVVYHSLYFSFLELGGFILVAIVYHFGGTRVLTDEIEWGTLIAILQYVPRFFMPIRNLSDRYATAQLALASSERIFEILDTDPESTGDGYSQKEVRGSIEFQNVWFAYRGEEWVLRDVSFKADPGENIAIVGATGAGKSTIINLVCGFYQVQRGSILVDGTSIDEWDLSALRRRIGIVQQDIFLFAGDIHHNIALGKPEISRDRVRQVADAVKADSFIGNLPDGYDTMVQERGSDLSQGQCQLLSFARALAPDPDILVLDEATASVDTHTEMRIQQAIEHVTRVRTSIIIAHRLATVRSAHRILVMHHGELREQGSHDDLISANGLYARLHRLQFEPIEIDG